MPAISSSESMHLKTMSFFSNAVIGQEKHPRIIPLWNYDFHSESLPHAERNPALFFKLFKKPIYVNLSLLKGCRKIFWVGPVHNYFDTFNYMFTDLSIGKYTEKRPNKCMQKRIYVYYIYIYKFKKWKFWEFWCWWQIRPLWLPSQLCINIMMSPT